MDKQEQTTVNITPHERNGVDLIDRFRDKKRVELSPSEVAHDIWLFKVGRNRKDEPYAVLAGLYHNEVYNRLAHIGFYKRRPDGLQGEENSTEPFFIRQYGSVIEPVEIGYMLDEFKKQRIDNASTINFEYSGRTFKIPAQKLKETFYRQFHLVFNRSALQNLKEHTAPILKDTPSNAYFVFRNDIFQATKQGYQKIDDERLDGQCVWKGHIIDRDFHPDESEGHFQKFLSNVTGGDTDRYNALRTAIGYLLHNYVSPAHGQAIIFYDETPAKKGEPEGGRGKGLVVNGVKQVRNTAKIDGKKFDPDDRFRWQSLSRQTQVLWIDDVKTNFPFEVLHSSLTDGWNVEKKREHEFYIKPEDSPKVVIASNTVLSNEGTTNRRRQFIVEFGDHYSRHIKKGTEEPIKDEHGCIFFSEDWNQAEWNRFFSYMLECTALYLKFGLVGYEHKNVAENQLLQRTDEDFPEWIRAKGITVGQKYDKRELFMDFRNTYKGDDSDLKQNTFTKWLKLYASLKGWTVNQSRSDGKNYVKFQ